jgi:hypothetical protein
MAHCARHWCFHFFTPTIQRWNNAPISGLRFARTNTPTLRKNPTKITAVVGQMPLNSRVHVGDFRTKKRIVEMKRVL